MNLARRLLPLGVVLLVACSDPTGTPPSPDEEGKNPPTDDTRAIHLVTDSVTID